MIHKCTYIYCDGCSDPNPFDPDRQMNNGTTREQRRRAKDYGWSYSKGKDYCPECTQRRRLATGKAGG